MTPRKWREEEKKLTLEQLAKLVGVTPSYISRVERGMQMPSGKVMRAYHVLSNGVVKPTDFKSVNQGE